MQIAYMPFGVTRPLLDEFCRTPTTKHASERAYTESLTGDFLSSRAKKEQAICNRHKMLG